MIRSKMTLVEFLPVINGLRVIKYNVLQGRLAVEYSRSAFRDYDLDRTKQDAQGMRLRRVVGRHLASERGRKSSCDRLGLR